MFLKSKISLLKKSSFLCLFLIMGSFAAILNAAEKAEFVISNDPFVYKGLSLIPGKKYTREFIEEKLGKPDWYEAAPLDWSLSYEDKIIFDFNLDNSFKGIIFKAPEKVEGLNIYGLLISKNDNHSTIVKKLIKLKKNFEVIFEVPAARLTTKVKINSKFGNIELTIECSASEDQGLKYVDIWYNN